MIVFIYSEYLQCKLKLVQKTWSCTIKWQALIGRSNRPLNEHSALNAIFSTILICRQKPQTKFPQKVLKECTPRESWSNSCTVLSKQDFGKWMREQEAYHMASITFPKNVIESCRASPWLRSYTCNLTLYPSCGKSNKLQQNRSRIQIILSHESASLVATSAIFLKFQRSLLEASTQENLREPTLTE